MSIRWSVPVWEKIVCLEWSHGTNSASEKINDVFTKLMPH